LRQRGQYLVATQRANPDALLIHGGSAGGYTTLCALTFHSDFRAGASYFGIGDLTAMTKDTHKFESRYSTAWWTVARCERGLRSEVADLPH